MSYQGMYHQDMPNSQRTHYRDLERATWIRGQILAGKYPNANTIAEHFEITPKTIQRTIAFMRERMDWPIKYSAKHRGFYFDGPAPLLSGFKLTEGEAVSILMAERLARAYGGGKLGAEIATALAKVADSLTDTISVNLGEFLALQSVEPLPSSPIDHTHFTALENATRERRCVRMTYFTQSTGETSERIINPLHLHNAKAEWYVIAFDHKRNDIRDFHIGRIRELAVLKEVFAPPPDFDINRHLESGFGMFRSGGTLQEVVVEFDAHQARWIRQQSKVHPTAEYDELPDGRLRVSMRVGALEGVKMWILQYGARAKVVQPESLRAEILTELRLLMDEYDPDSIKKS